VRLVQPGQERPEREREGIDEQRDEPRVVELGEAHRRNPVVRRHGRGVEALDLSSRQRARPDGHRRTLSSSRTRATTPSATQPSRCPGAGSSRTASAAARASTRCIGERKMNARSTSAPASAPPSLRPPTPTPRSTDRPRSGTRASGAPSRASVYVGKDCVVIDSRAAGGARGGTRFGLAPGSPSYGIGRLAGTTALETRVERDQDAGPAPGGEHDGGESPPTPRDRAEP
jgi:hypothetical protein